MAYPRVRGGALHRNGYRPPASEVARQRAPVVRAEGAGSFGGLGAAACCFGRSSAASLLCYVFLLFLNPKSGFSPRMSMSRNLSKRLCLVSGRLAVVSP